MATFLALLNFTDQGIRSVKDTTKRAAAARELAKAAGIEPGQQDTRLQGDREALIGELRAEREAAARQAEAAHAAELAEQERTEQPEESFVDPFKS